MVTGRESSVLETMTRRELLEDNNGVMGASGKELCLASDSSPKVRGWEELVGRKVIWQGSVSFWGFRQRDWKRIFWSLWSKSENEGKECTVNLSWKN